MTIQWTDRFDRLLGVNCIFADSYTEISIGFYWFEVIFSRKKRKS